MPNGNTNIISLDHILQLGRERTIAKRSITKKILGNLAKQQNEDLPKSFPKWNRPDMIEYIFEMKITKNNSKTQKATIWDLRCDFIKDEMTNTYRDYQNVSLSYALANSTDFDFGYKAKKARKGSRNAIFTSLEKTGNVITFSSMLDAINAADRVHVSMGRKPNQHTIQGKSEIEDEDIFFLSPSARKEIKRNTGSYPCDIGCPSHNKGHTSSFFKHAATDCGFSYATGQAMLANGLCAFVIPFVGYWICELSDDEMMAIMLTNSCYSVDGHLNSSAKKLIACVQAHDAEWNSGKKFM